IVDANQTLTLDGTTITGGSISDNGTVNIDGSNTLKLNGVELKGGKITNAGTVEVNGTGGIESDASSNNMQNHATNLILTQDGTTITGGTINDYDSNGGGIIHVTGASAINGGATLNKGTVNVDGKLTLDTMTVSGTTINDNSDGSIELDNTVKLTGGATIRG